MLDQEVSRLLKTIYHAVESAQNCTFESNSGDQSEAAINHVAACFDVPNFISVSIDGEVYLQVDKRHFIEDMRMHFADNPNYTIDGMFEYHITPPQPVPLITFQLPEKYKNKTFAEVMDIV